MSWLSPTSTWGFLYFGPPLSPMRSSRSPLIGTIHFRHHPSGRGAPSSWWPTLHHHVFALGQHQWKQLPSRRFLSSELCWTRKCWLQMARGGDGHHLEKRSHKNGGFWKCWESEWRVFWIRFNIQMREIGKFLGTFVSLFVEKSMEHLHRNGGGGKLNLLQGSSGKGGYCGQ